jgi:hypothetical protein
MERLTLNFKASQIKTINNGLTDGCRHYHAFCSLYGLGLDDDVLKKIYYKNDLKLSCN